MKSLVRKLIAPVVLATSLALLVGCSGSNSGGPPPSSTKQEFKKETTNGHGQAFFTDNSTSENVTINTDDINGDPISGTVVNYWDPDSNSFEFYLAENPDYSSGFIVPPHNSEWTITMLSKDEPPIFTTIDPSTDEGKAVDNFIEENKAYAIDLGYMTPDELAQEDETQLMIINKFAPGNPLNYLSKAVAKYQDFKDFIGIPSQEPDYYRVYDGLPFDNITTKFRMYIPDSDQDEVPEGTDNCPYNYNPDQLDSDGNGVGDVCQPVVPVDSDSDGIFDADDNCPDTYNPDQFDYNSNGTGDLCETPIAVLPGDIILAGVHPDDGDKEIYAMKTNGDDPHVPGTENQDDPKNLSYVNSNETQPNCSPDGTRIANVTDWAGDIDIEQRNRNGTLHDQDWLASSSTDEFAPLFSPDGAKVAYRTVASVYVTNSDIENGQRLTNKNPPLNLERAPTWIDNDNLAIETFYLNDSNAEIYSANLSGGLTNLTNNPTKDFLPKTSPNRNLIGFLSDRDGQDAIHAMDPDGTNVTKISGNRNYVDFSWYPNNNFITGVAQENSNNNLYMIPLSGAEPKLLVSGVVPDYGSPLPLADGSVVYVKENNAGEKQLYRIHPDMTINQLTSDGSDYYGPTWCTN